MKKNVTVTLRRKRIKGGKLSLYLDFYPPIANPDTGRPTRREFLSKHVFENPKTLDEKKYNREAEAFAELVRNDRQTEVDNRRYGFLSDKHFSTDFVGYFRELADKRKGSNNDNWVSALHYLERFTGGKKNMNELTVKFCEDFRYHLLNASSSRTSGKPLAQNSAHSYFNKFKAALKQAYKDGYLQTDLNVQVTPIRQKETQRTFLTEEELQTLVDTPCDSKLLKRAGIFSALTGMRHSDIVNLRWRDIQHRQGGGYTVHHRQQKTDNVESLPISDEAYSLLGKMGEPDGQVFAGLTYSAHNNHLLQKWVWRAGINKEFTFHCFRHTYATIQLTKGTPITTLMELLGHKDIKQTLVYAKIVEPLKREAANKMSVRLNPEMI